MKVIGLMRTDSNIGHCYEKIVMEFIVNIFNECNVEGSKD